MKITEVAKLLETTPRTIRFYEEKELIFPQKAANGYRIYTEEEVGDLRTILALREIGLYTKEIKKALEQNDDFTDYLHTQRSLLNEEMLQIRDMMVTIDRMIEVSGKAGEEEQMMDRARELKGLKEKRTNWRDRWDFDDQAKDYDNNIKTTGYRFNVHQDYEEALEKVHTWMDASHEERGADIGAGTGNLTRRFLKQGISMAAVDQSKEMLKVCGEKHPGVETRLGHFLSLPLKDQEVDFVVSSYALHHLPDEDKELALEEIDRVLSDYGRVVIADLMFKDESDRKSILESYQEEGNEEAIEAIEDEYYADRSRLMRWWEEHGYDVKVHQFNPILHLLYAQKMERGVNE
ncbi:methyltransferase domain-containing protein [Halobacillus sp. GSS1]|uniref:MerR family transcriptional regulator n=1 Tax=Halobacillus sp. GSS1 TaxID=2815919 RepID=UPI001A90076D|nr:methyltransferase domain-containing protein [Halobacillus sp. GSS1]MBN9654911.1 methyltransferase domain-containing protein [Halobacillus sp. GSS1]